MNSITGIAVGSKGSFSALAVPAGSTIIGGGIPAWLSDNVLAVVSVSADGLSATVTVDPTAVVGGSFNLSVSVTQTDAANTVASGTASIPFLAPPPPPPVPVASFDINQTA